MTITENILNNLFVCFLQKQFKLQSMMKTLEADHFQEVKFKNKTLILCSLLKNELNTLMLKMERYNETRIERYNNLVSYLNSYPDFKNLLPLKPYH